MTKQVLIELISRGELNFRRSVAAAPVLTILALFAMFAFVVGCASGPEATNTPSPTATAAPTATLAPTPTPPPTDTPVPTPTATPLVEPAGSLEDLFLADTTLGGEVMSRLSKPETDCIRGALGEAVYAAVLNLPMTRLVRESGAGGAGSFLRCLTEDNLVLMGEVLIDSHHGRTDIEARECRVAAARANPDVIRIRFELLRSEMGTLDAESLLSTAREQFDCLNALDQANLLVRLTTTLDEEDTFTGQDIVEMLPEEEVSCIREGVGDALFAGFLNSTVTGAFAPSASLLDCLALESKTALFATFTASRVEGLREEAVTCMANLVADSPNILALGFGTLDVEQMAEGELARLGDEAATLFDCLNSDEVIQVLTLPAVVEQ